MMRRLFLGAADTARRLMDHPRLEESWDQHGALELMTVGALSAHLARAVTVVPGYLDTDGHPPLRDAPDYFLALSPQADTDLDSELSRSVRARAEEEAQAGLAAVVSSWDDARRELGRRLPEEDLERPIRVRSSTMQIGDYLITRLVELVVHTDDLAVSLQAPTPPFEPAVTNEVIICLTEMARRRHSDLEVIRAMSRRERADPGVLRSF